MLIVLYLIRILLTLIIIGNIVKAEETEKILMRTSQKDDKADVI